MVTNRVRLGGFLQDCFVNCLNTSNSNPLSIKKSYPSRFLVTNWRKPNGRKRLLIPQQELLMSTRTRAAKSKEMKQEKNRFYSY